MNTKGMKFLAVLAVMVMAFAAVIVLAPADKDVDAIAVYNNDEVMVDPVVIYGNEIVPGTTSTKITDFYISDDATVKIRGLTGDMKFYVQNGKELELNIKLGTSSTTSSTSGTITIYSVTSDQQRITTSTVNSGGENDIVEGKIKINNTEVKFTPNATQTVVYKAMMPYKVTTHTTSGDGIVTVVDTANLMGLRTYATISSDDTLKSATIKSYVTVAPGQAIQTDGPVDVVYGIMVMDDSETAAPYTYYAKGMNAGTVTIETNDLVYIKDGTVSVSAKDTGATLRATSAKSTATNGTEVKTTDNKTLTVAGSITGGSINISGDVIFDNFTDKATVTLAGTAYVKSGKIIVKGTLILKNDAEKILNLEVEDSGTIVAQNEKLWTYEGTKPYLKFKGTLIDDLKAFTGLADVSAITKSADVKEAFSTAKIERNQTFVVIADTVVTTSLTVEGVLIINPGVTLTITKTNSIGADVILTGQYGQIINNGEIQIKTTTPIPVTTSTTTTASTEPQLAGLHIFGGYAVNEGKIIASSDNKTDGATTLEVNFAYNYPLAGKGIGFVNNGTITASKNDSVFFDDNFTNAGSVSINGALTGNKLANNGSFTLNNAVIKTGGLTVTMGDYAVFSIVAAEIEPGASIVINDETSDVVTSTVAVKADTLGESETGKYVVRGLTVTNTKYTLDVSGSIGISQPTNKTSKLYMAGYVSVADSATVNSGYEVSFSTTGDDALTGANMSVYGNMSFVKGVKFAEDEAKKLNMTVTGLVTTETGKLAGCTYVAAKFTAGETDYYTTLDSAVTTASLADVGLIEVGGDVTNKKFVKITDDLTIPTGMTVVSDSALAGKGVVIIDEKATVYVSSNAMLSIDKIIVEDGMLVAESANDVDMGSVEADVVEEDDESTAAVAMSLEVALMLATPGDVIELSQSFFGADETLVIPEGVTVDATAADTATDFVLVNSDLVVNGNLVVDEFKFIATTDDTIGITLNGYIYDSCAGGTCFNGWWYVPFGVSYYLTDEENDEVWFVLTSINNIQPAINVADDAKVHVTGDANNLDLNLTGRDDMPAEVTFEGNVNNVNVGIDDVTLKFTDGKKVTVSVSDAYGSITIIGAYAKDNLSIYNLEENGVYMEGTVTDNVRGTYSILFDGITGMDGTTRSAIAWGNYGDAEEDVMFGYPSVFFNGTTVVTGKRAIISDDAQEYSDGAMVTVTGTLYADNNAKLKIYADVQVLGALVAAERTEEAIAGSIEANGNIFVGALESDIYNIDAAIKAYEADPDYTPAQIATLDYNGYGQSALAAAAVLSGNIELGIDTSVDPVPFFITVMSGSLVDDQIIEDLVGVPVIIEDEEWLTVYGYDGSPYSMDGLLAPIVNAKVNTIVNIDGTEVAKFNHDYKVVYGSVNRDISTYGRVVFTLDYDVFTIEIKTDGSVKAVYIDGILMRTGQNANIFLLEKVATGTHKVTVEPSAGYTADGCILYTDYGTILPNMTFTFTEYDCDDYMVTYDIKGTQVEPEPVPPTPEEESQWTITTILLVILVVLIAIMAVIVALRLNRS